MGKYIDCDYINFKIGYETFPDRKKPMLVVQEGNKGYALASFKNKDNADYFMKKLLDFVRSCQIGAEKHL